LQLETRPVLGRDGRFLPEPPRDVPAEAYAPLVGKTVHTGRQILVDMLREKGALRGEPRPITHPVKFYEKGDRPLEIVTSRQWYIRNGGRDEELRARLLDRGAELQWVPAHMQVRYGRLADQPPAVLRRADPALVPAGRRRRAGPRRRPGAGRHEPAGRPEHRRAAGLHRGPA
jgi:hypothetical protein